MFMPCILRNKLRDEFDHLEQVSMSLSMHETHFLTSSRHTAASISTKLKRIKKIVKGLYSYNQLATTQLVVSGGSFQSLVDHAKIIETFRQGM